MLFTAPLTSQRAYRGGHLARYIESTLVRRGCGMRPIGDGGADFVWRTAACLDDDRSSLSIAIMRWLDDGIDE